MDYYEESESLSVLNKRKKITVALIYIGNTYYTMADYENAIKFYEKGLSKVGDDADPIDIVAANHNIALCKLNLGEYHEVIDVASFAAQKALAIESDMFYAFSNELIARAKYGLGEVIQAIDTIQVSTAIYKEKTSHKES